MVLSNKFQLIAKPYMCIDSLLELTFDQKRDSEGILI